MKTACYEFHGGDVSLLVCFGKVPQRNSCAVKESCKDKETRRPSLLPAALRLKQFGQLRDFGDYSTPCSIFLLSKATSDKFRVFFWVFMGGNTNLFQYIQVQVKPPPVGLQLEWSKELNLTGVAKVIYL